MDGFIYSNNAAATNKKTTRRGRKFQSAKSNLAEYLKKNQPIVLPVASPRPTTKAELIGFYVNWDDTSFTSLKHNLSRLDKLIGGVSAPGKSVGSFNGPSDGFF